MCERALCLSLFRERWGFQINVFHWQILRLNQQPPTYRPTALGSTTAPPSHSVGAAVAGRCTAVDSVFLSKNCSFSPRGLQNSRYMLFHPKTSLITAGRKFPNCSTHVINLPNHIYDFDNIFIPAMCVCSLIWDCLGNILLQHITVIELLYIYQA